MVKRIREKKEILNSLEKANISLWDSKLDELADLHIIEVLLDLIICDKTPEEFEAAVEIIRFARTINEFTEGSKTPDLALEFYAQHKKEIDTDKNKASVFQKKFRIQSLPELRQDFKSKFHYLPIFYDDLFREGILTKQDSKCGLCEKDLSKIVPHFHHIDYNKRNCAEENLIFLCPRCHGKTNSNRDFWKGLLVERKLNPEHI